MLGDRYMRLGDHYQGGSIYEGMYIYIIEDIYLNVWLDLKYVSILNRKKSFVKKSSFKYERCI